MMDRSEPWITKEATMKRRFSILIMMMIGLGSEAWAQFPMANPEDLGLRVPIGPPVQLVEDQRVLVPVEGDSNAEPRVCQVYLAVGDRYVVLPPSGILRSVLKRDCTPTDRPFQPDTDQLAEVLQSQFPGFKVRSTKRYLCVYNTSDSFRENVMRILETMNPKLEKYFDRQRFDVESPPMPLVVVMFRTKADFLRYRRMPEGILAYYNTVDNRIFLYQHSETNVNAPTIAAKQTISTIAHEGVHQILHNIGVQTRLSRWPMWIGEGLAEYFSPTHTTAQAKWKGVGKPNDLRMRELFAYLSSARDVGSGRTVARIVTASEMDSTDYAIAWALTHYLATKRKKDFFAYLHEVSELKPLQNSGDERARFVKHFGKNLSGIEKQMIKHVRSLPYADPMLNQPHYLVAMVAGNRRSATVTTSRDFDKTKARLVQRLTGAQRAQARFSIRTFPNRRLAEQAMLVFTSK